MARMLAALFAAGATLALLALALPHPTAFYGRAIVVLSSAAYLAAVTLVAFGARLRPAAFHLAVCLGTLLIAGACYWSGQTQGAFSLFFLWVGLYSFYFFPLQQALGQVAIVAVAYGSVLILRSPNSSPVTPCLLCVGTLTVAGVLVSRLVRQVHGHAADLALIAATSNEMLTSSDPEHARPAVCEAARTLTGARSVLLLEPDPARAGLRGTAGAGPRTSPTPPLLAAAAESHRTGLASMIAATDWQLTTSDQSAEQRRTTYHLQPILGGGGPIGVMAFEWAGGAARVARRTATAIELLAAEAAVAIGHAELLARLDSAARQDHLTGLANRRALFEELDVELNRATRDGRPLCLAMLDLDNFKAFNDSLGHQAGDRHLKETTAAWRTRVRPEDLLARYGGEEFTLILPGCPIENALEVTDRVRGATPNGQTCSAGVSEWNRTDTADQLIARTDLALYEAKRTGRNRTAKACYEAVRHG